MECFAVWKRGRDNRNRLTEGGILLHRTCEWCGRPFTAEKRQVDKGLGRFCSRQCNAARRAVPRLVISCERCGKTFEFLPNRIFLAGGRFCSRRCFRDARREEKLPPEGDRGRAYRNFRDAWVAERGACERCGSQEDVFLHHRVRTRERPDLLFEPDNLEVLCRSCHTRHHEEMGHMRVPEVAHEFAN
jgi:5-methylcytosine-specific restriction endonuclease McrA